MTGVESNNKKKKIKQKTQACKTSQLEQTQSDSRQQVSWGGLQWNLECHETYLWDKQLPSSPHSDHVEPCSKHSLGKLPWGLQPPKEEDWISLTKRRKRNEYWRWRCTAYILWIRLCCIVRASHNQAVRGGHGTISSLFSLPQHHWHWFWSVKRHLPDTMFCPSCLQRAEEKITYFFLLRRMPNSAEWH